MTTGTRVPNGARTALQDAPPALAMQRRYVLALIDRRIAQIEHGDTPVPEATSGRLPRWLSRIFGEP